MHPASSIALCLEDAAQEFLSNLAVITPHAQVTYRELHELSRKLASQLEASGLGAGAGVALQAPNSLEFVVGLLALLRIGAVAIPIPTNLAEVELAQFVAETPVEAILGTEVSADNIFVLSTFGNLKLHSIVSSPRRRPFVSHVPQAAVIRPTSGTTGLAKGVVFSHQDVLDRLDVVQRTFQLSPSDRVIWVLPMAYHFIASVLLYLKTGAAIVVTESHLPDVIMEATRKHDGTLLFASPSIIASLAELPSNFGSLSRFPNFRWAISTSAALSSSINSRFTERHGFPARQVFGIIEVGLPLGNLTPQHAVPESVGLPLNGYEVQIRNDRGEAAEVGEVGNLLVKGPGLFSAYLNPATTSQEVLVDGFFNTMDLAAKNSDGSYQIKGRSKSTINFAGVKIFPEDVESVILAHPKIASCRVYGEPHSQLGELVCVDVVARPHETVPEAELRQFCRVNLSSQKVPQIIRFRDSIALTNTGKVKRW